MRYRVVSDTCGCDPEKYETRAEAERACREYNGINPKGGDDASHRIQKRVWVDV